jgi:hypothetical protein
VRSIFPLHSLEIVRNGEVVARVEADGRRQAEINEELRIDGNSWIAVCRGVAGAGRARRLGSLLLDFVHGPAGALPGERCPNFVLKIASGNWSFPQACSIRTTAATVGNANSEDSDHQRVS